MFNWICPECGRDVSPSESECRFCAERKKAAALAAPPVDPATVYGAPPPQQPQTPAPAPPPSQQQRIPEAPQAYAPPQAYEQPQQYAPPPQQQYYAPPPQQQPPQPYYPGAYPPPQRSGLPTWALGLLFGLAFIGLLLAILYGYQYFGKGPRAERAGVTEPAATARSKPANALQKNIEVVESAWYRMPATTPKPNFW